MPDGTVVLRGTRCAFFYQRPAPGVVLMRIVGSQLDTGDLGNLPMNELADDLARWAPVELFIDASEAAGAAVAVQEGWTEWFARNRSALKAVNMLVRGNYMHFTVEIVRLFSRTGELIRIYLDAKPFGEALRRAAPGT
jgi:hypothetical protein